MPAPSLRALSALFVSILIVRPAAAQTWTGADAGGPGWSRAGNWTPGVPSSSGGAQVTFDTPGPFNYNPDQDIVNPFPLNRLTFTGSFSNTIVGGGFDFRGAAAITVSSTANPSISNINRSELGTLSISGGGALTVTSSALGANSALRVTLGTVQILNGTRLAFAPGGTASLNGVSGGTGFLVVSGANSAIAAGTSQILIGVSSGAAGSLTVTNGATA